jgi:hypothetical protein
VERYVNAAEAAKFLSINRRTLLVAQGVVQTSNGPRRLDSFCRTGLVDAQPRRPLPSVLSKGGNFKMRHGIRGSLTKIKRRTAIGLALPLAETGSMAAADLNIVVGVSECEPRLMPRH